MSNVYSLSGPINLHLLVNESRVVRFRENYKKLHFRIFVSPHIHSKPVGEAMDGNKPNAL